MGDAGELGEALKGSGTNEPKQKATEPAKKIEDDTLSPELEARLKKLVSQDHTVLFMKGTPDEPRCKFSRSVINALHELEGVTFSHFNILEDEEVRAGLKKFSDWPTYPQLYISGELVGGCDIILEMAKSGELAKAMTH